MKIHAFSVKPLALAVVAALALSAPVVGRSIDKPIESPAVATGTFTGTVLFGGASSSDARPSSLFGLPMIRPADAVKLAPGASTRLLAIVHASSLPLGEQEGATLAGLFKQGTPVLVRMDSRTPEAIANVATHFGSAPEMGDMIVRYGEDATEVFASASEEVADASTLLDAFAVAAKALRPRRPEAAIAAVLMEADAPEPEAGLPTRKVNHNLIDLKGEMAGVTTVEVVRSRTMATDWKLVRLSSKNTITPIRAGVINIVKPVYETWFGLPFEYTLRHDVEIKDGKLVYLNHFPVSDGTTEFKQEETKTEGFTIGGSLGADVSTTGKKDPALAAKLPFDASFSYEKKWQSTLSNSFKDYSLQAAFQRPAGVRWKALLAPKLDHMRRPTLLPDRPEYLERDMTPMMRNAAFDTASYWQMPGTYEGLLYVTISAEYDLTQTHWLGRMGLIGGLVGDARDVHRVVRNTFKVAMNHPSLTAEMTVLLRSATASGLCLRDNSGLVDLVACQPADRSQQWGLDELSHYVNRGSKKCLTAQPATGSVVTESCENLTFEKQWQWRADRLHSLINHERYRMYVAGGKVLISKPRQFPDFPENFSSPALEPWTNYPSAPREGIDQVVGRAGTRPIPVGPEYARFPAVTDDQRWRIEVLRQREEK